MTTESAWTFRFGDGSGNLYLFTGQTPDSGRFEYQPMTPLYSSSGHYSGGEPTSCALTAEDLQSLRAHFAEWQADSANHAEQREKGTGSLTWEEQGQRRHFILRRGAAVEAALEVLKAFRSRS